MSFLVIVQTISYFEKVRKIIYCVACVAWQTHRDYFVRRRRPRPRRRRRRPRRRHKNGFRPIT